MTIEVTSNDVGRKVVYRPAVGDAEEGVISSLRAPTGFVFVRYGTNTWGSATPVDRLEWIDALS